jgi:hypothetical protein
VGAISDAANALLQSRMFALTLYPGVLADIAKRLKIEVKLDTLLPTRHVGVRAADMPEVLPQGYSVAVLLHASALSAVAAGGPALAKARAGTSAPVAASVPSLAALPADARRWYAKLSAAGKALALPVREKLSKGRWALETARFPNP